LRISECGRLDTETTAEITSGLRERLIGDRGPEVELIAGLMASEALEEMAGDVDRAAG
jgi:hypothetical protein